MDDTPLDAALHRLAALHVNRIDLGLERVLALLDALGAPHRRLPPVIHVAGTNGKGSVVAYLRALARESGLVAHAYTSPHLVRFNERIVIADREIDDGALLDALLRVEAVNAGAPITFFEITTAAAFLLFAETPADVCLLEVGLGGRFDATNVIERPHASVVTPVGVDHVEFLGGELVGIALEKAGIFKAGAPAIIGPQDPQARAALVEAALMANAKPLVWGVDYRARLDGGRLHYEGSDRVLDLEAPALFGAHQVTNAGAALAAAIASGLFDPDRFEHALAQAVWPGRLQRLGAGRLVDIVSQYDGEVWVDGAHNPLGAFALAQALADLTDRQPRPLVLVTALQANKDAGGFYATFADLVRGVVCAPMLTSQASARCETLVLRAREAGLSAFAAPGLETALKAADRWRLPGEPGPRVVICGSLYLVGEALALNGGGAGRQASAS